MKNKKGKKENRNKREEAPRRRTEGSKNKKKKKRGAAGLGIYQGTTDEASSSSELSVLMDPLCYLCFGNALNNWVPLPKVHSPLFSNRLPHH